MPRAHYFALISLTLTACPPGDGSDADATTTSGGVDDSGATIPTGGEDPGQNPFYRGLLSGTTVDSVYARVRVGHLDLPDADGCCTDYVLAGPAQNHVKVLFGAPARGLLFLSDAPDQTFEMGPANVGIEDVVVIDIDEDGNEDIVVLRSDGVVGIRHGLGVTAPSPVLSDTLFETNMTVSGVPASRSLAVADLDCDGKKDLVAVSPMNDRVILAFAAPGGTFLPPLQKSTGLGSPRQVVVGDLNGDDEFDIITGNGDGSASVLLNECFGEFAGVANYPLFSEPFATPDMQVAVGRVCIGETSGDWPAIALGHGQRVHILCGNGQGTYDAIDEEPSPLFGTALDYLMDSNPKAPLPSAKIFQLQYWESTMSLHVLWSDSPFEIARFVASQDPVFQGGVPVANLGGRSPGHAFSMHQAAIADDPNWSRIVVIVDTPGATDVSFAR